MDGRYWIGKKRIKKRSFVEVVTGRSGVEDYQYTWMKDQADGVITIQWKVNMRSTLWLDRCLVGETKDLETLIGFLPALQAMKLFDGTISYLGEKTGGKIGLRTDVKRKGKRLRGMTSRKVKGHHALRKSQRKRIEKEKRKKENYITGTEAESEPGPLNCDNGLNSLNGHVDSLQGHKWTNQAIDKRDIPDLNSLVQSKVNLENNYHEESIKSTRISNTMEAGSSNSIRIRSTVPQQKKKITLLKTLFVPRHKFGKDRDQLNQGEAE
ncbi:hypothetical protein L2E82_19708 [Cichorium intybus]|uniref:Uncharacterized protein n=1 Tax=Cichorium intybus TaxID=13427 RepID=A0ACB9FCJ2_CICIN|nr:hypothetical protein L2E82_19708 [Cichorium intybus]